MRYRILTSLLLLGLLLTASSCASFGATSGQPDKPVASITAPENGSHFNVGQAVVVKFGATDMPGVAQMEVTINGRPAYVETVAPPVNAFVADYTWTPEKSGSFVIQAVAFSLDGDSSEPAQVVVTVTETGDDAPPAPPAGQTPIAGPATPTPRPVVPTPAPASTGDQVGLKPIVTALVALNVRTGPGKDYPVVGRLAQGQSAEITGQDEGAYWWQIVFPSDNGNGGWVAAGGEFSEAVNAGAVPVVETPPPPGNAGPPASPTPDALKPTIYTFTANRYTIAPGESVTLSWDLANATAAYLRYNNLEEGVVAPGHKTVSPDQDTVYTLIARNEAGETTAELTVTVAGQAPTPVPVLRDGKTRLVHAQSIDFDQGLVQDNVGPASDFYWDWQQKQFFPKGGASGALLSKSYGDITLPDCLAAAYDRPIDVGGGAVLLTGCYKTNEGRYGKFYVSDWDLGGNLTVEWLTWDYP
ncbi:MAG: SH3 domain-containing protein [Anaerolineae bacterium]|nr:SH3 domain-containing protein [Anaerolineae bacterium]